MDADWLPDVDGRVSVGDAARLCGCKVLNNVDLAVLRCFLSCFHPALSVIGMEDGCVNIPVLSVCQGRFLSVCGQRGNDKVFTSPRVRLNGLGSRFKRARRFFLGEACGLIGEGAKRVVWRAAYFL